MSFVHHECYGKVFRLMQCDKNTREKKSHATNSKNKPNSQRYLGIISNVDQRKSGWRDRLGGGKLIEEYKVEQPGG